ncbi:DUF6919 domain-containing protein [Streptomyces sp. NRRL S-241]|uniref:DUF6919 domain-containing protein n=1 Tax=Streptomyces sp. NRRL S-241 TaxID=1463896 RepID=UPI000A997AE9|nr:hypothetical protein [Streptomyces sp. NRRL S-241]
MSRSDRRAWRSARTLADLGRRTADWLEGRLASQPGYMPRCGPDEESAELVPSLVALNRAGFMTTCSQPGLAEYGYDGAWWTQHAAVEGYLTDRALLQQLLDAAEALGHLVVVDDPHIGRRDKVVVVTHRDGEPYTAFGSRPEPLDMDAFYGVLHPEARRELDGAIHLAVIASYYGPASHRALWRSLDQVTGLEPPDADEDQDDTADGPAPGIST